MTGGFIEVPQVLSNLNGDEWAGPGSDSTLLIPDPDHPPWRTSQLTLN
jgi:hypothetical protein